MVMGEEGCRSWVSMRLLLCPKEDKRGLRTTYYGFGLLCHIVEYYVERKQ
jgi:hypothetical protein